MLYERILSLFNGVPKDNSLYLLEKISEHSGFFATDGRLVYIAVNAEDLPVNGVDTDQISLRSGVHITSVDNYPQFAEGSYNLLILKDEVSSKSSRVFIKLCLAYANDSEELGFGDFFYSLVEYFQLPREQSTKNLYGLFGELALVDYVMTNYGVNLAPKWHIYSTNDKYDFSGSNKNIEVKTIVGQGLSVKIKHRQLFNDDDNSLVVVAIEHNSSGEVLRLLIDRLMQNSRIRNDFQFLLRLERELLRIKESDLHDIPLSLVSISIYDTDDLQTIDNIPDHISEISYKYDLAGVPTQTHSKQVFELGDSLPV